jgi:hypothetical protein
MAWWGSNGAPQPVTYPELPSPRTKEDFERLADDCFEQLMRLEKEGPEAGWTSIDFQATNGEEEVRIWDKTVSGSPVNCVKTQGVIPCSPMNLFKVMCEEDLAKRQEYEKECSCYEIVREVTPEIAITRARYKAPFPVTSREVVAFRARRRLPGGGYVSFGKSINYDECLTDSSHVRAALHLVGAICRPIPGEPNRCMLTRIAQLDPKGNIPTMVVNATKKKSGTSVILLRKVIRRRNLPPAVEEETDEPGSEEEEDDEEEEEDREEEVGASTRGEEVDVYVAHTSGVVVRPDHAQPAPPRHIAAAIDHSAEGKGKEKETTGSVAVATTSTGDAEAGDEVYYEAASSLPWDERPFKQMYGQHRDEVNQIVSSLQQSMNRLEQLSLSNEQKLQTLERMCADLVSSRDRALVNVQQQQQSSTRPLVDFTNLSWGTLAFLAVWPVVAYSAYDLLYSRMRPPRK